MEVIRGDCAPDVGGPVGVDGDEAARRAVRPALLIEPEANAVDPTSPASWMSTCSGRTTPVPATAFVSERIQSPTLIGSEGKRFEPVSVHVQ